MANKTNLKSDKDYKLKLEDLKKYGSALALFLAEQIKDHLCSQFGIYGHAGGGKDEEKPCAR